MQPPLNSEKSSDFTDENLHRDDFFGRSYFLSVYFKVHLHHMALWVVVSKPGQNKKKQSMSSYHQRLLRKSVKVREH